MRYRIKEYILGGTPWFMPQERWLIFWRNIYYVGFLRYDEARDAIEEVKKDRAPPVYHYPDKSPTSVEVSPSAETEKYFKDHQA